MADDVDQRMLYSAQIGFRIVLSGAVVVDTGGVKAGNGIIRLKQIVILQIHPSGVVQDIQLCSH